MGTHLELIRPQPASSCDENTARKPLSSSPPGLGFSGGRVGYCLSDHGGSPTHEYAVTHTARWMFERMIPLLKMWTASPPDVANGGCQTVAKYAASRPTIDNQTVTAP